MMMLRSSAFEDTQTMPPKYAKKGGDIQMLTLYVNRW